MTTTIFQSSSSISAQFHMVKVSLNFKREGEALVFCDFPENFIEITQVIQKI